MEQRDGADPATRPRLLLAPGPTAGARLYARQRAACTRLGVLALNIIYEHDGNPLLPRTILTSQIRRGVAKPKGYPLPFLGD